MRVLIAFDHFLRGVVSGQAQALLDKGHDVFLLTRDRTWEFRGDAEERQAILDMLVEKGAVLRQISSNRADISSVRSLRSEVSSWRPDVVSVHEHDELRLLAISSGHAPMVYTVHDPEPHLGDDYPLYRRLGQFLCRRSTDRFVVHGNLLREQMIPHAKGRPVDSVALGLWPAESVFPPPGTENVLFFGRLEEYKGINVLIDSFPLIRERHPNASLTIAGDGPVAPSLQPADGIDLRIGYIPEDEIEPLISRATVVAMPYLDASQSGVGLLAVRRGVPLVVTRTGELPGLVEDEAMVVEPGSATALCEALSRAIESDSVANRERIRDFANSRFSWLNVIDDYLEIFESARNSAGIRR